MTVEISDGAKILGSREASHDEMLSWMHAFCHGEAWMWQRGIYRIRGVLIGAEGQRSAILVEWQSWIYDDD